MTFTYQDPGRIYDAPNDGKGAQFTRQQITALQAIADGGAVPGDRISRLRSATPWPAYARALPSYVGTVTVTPGNTSTVRTLNPCSNGTTINEATYLPPSLTWRPRPGATAFIEPRAAHITTNLTATPASTRHRWRFFTDAPIFDVQVLGLANSGYVLLVDGAVVSVQASKATGSVTFFDTYNFSAETDGRRTKLVEIYGDVAFLFAGICVGTADEVWRAPVLPRVGFLGDSYTTDEGTCFKSWIAQMSRGLGFMEMRSGVAGSGYLSTNGGVCLKFRDRVSTDITPYALDGLVISGGCNDIPGYLTNNWTNADLQAEAAMLYAQVLAENPRMFVIALGPWRGSSGNAGSYTTPEMDTALQAAAQSHPEYGTRLIYVPTINDVSGPWQFGDLTTGNFSVYGNLSDGTHLVEAGGPYLGNRAIEGVRRVVETLAWA